MPSCPFLESLLVCVHFIAKNRIHFKEENEESCALKKIRNMPTDQKNTLENSIFPTKLRNMSKIGLIGNRELSVEGCKGVLEYEKNIIRLNLGNQQLKITGRNLMVRGLEKNLAEIEGYIIGLEFGL
jgi:sporulation protein YqfC